MARHRTGKPGKTKRDQAGKPQATQHLPWMHGRHPCLRALANPKRRVTRIIIKSGDPDLDTAVAEAIVQSGKERPDPEYRDAREIDAMVSPDARHQGIAILTDPLPDLALEDILADCADQTNPVLVILDQATDPRNVGAVLRSAAAFDVTAVIVQDRHGPQETGVMAKAASGAMETTPLVRVTNIVRAMETIKDQGFWPIGLDGQTDQTIAALDTDGKCALVLGAEGSGLRRLVREACDHLAKIPISNQMESLNLSNAAAIALYEVRRKG